MSDFSDIMDGIETTLEAGIEILQAFGYAPDAANLYPAAIAIPDTVDVPQNFGGNTIEVNIRIYYLTSSGFDKEAFRLLWNAIDPTDADESVIRAIRADRTLNGSVDDCDIIDIENIGRVEYGGGFYAGAEFILKVIKTIA